MRPRRRTQVLAALVLGTAALLVPSAFIGYEATIGGVWSHNGALDACAMRATANSAYEKAEIGVRDRWTWWLPGHSHVCVYDLGAAGRSGVQFQRSDGRGWPGPVRGNAP